MSGHSSRLTYDQCFINEDTQQSTKPGEYSLYDGQSNNDNSCHANLGPRNNRSLNSSEVSKGTTLSDRAEIESELSLRGTPSSKCSKNRTLDDMKKKLATELQESVYCDNFLNPTSSRLENSIDEYRGLSTLQLQLNYPLTNPLDNVFYGHNKTSLINQAGNSRGGTNTRLESKDNYSKKLN